MATLSNRVQVLFDDDRLQQMSAAAKSQGVSVGEFVRDAVDLALKDEPRRASQKAFMEFLDSIDPIDFGTIDDIRRLRDEAGARPFFDEAH